IRKGTKAFTSIYKKVLSKSGNRRLYILRAVGLLLELRLYSGGRGRLVQFPQDSGVVFEDFRIIHSFQERQVRFVERLGVLPFGFTVHETADLFDTAGGVEFADGKRLPIIVFGLFELALNSLHSGQVVEAARQKRMVVPQHRGEDRKRARVERLG